MKIRIITENRLLFLILISLLCACQDKESVVKEGKSTLVLSGEVTDSEAVNIISADVGILTQEVRIYNTNKLTKVDLSMLTSAIEVIIKNNGVLESIDLSGLTQLLGPFSVVDSPFLKTIKLNNLTEITNDSEFRNLELEKLDFPQLTHFTKLRLDNISLQSLTMPVLNNITSLTLMDVVISELSLPELFSASTISIINSDLINLSFPLLNTIGSFDIVNTSLSNLSCPLLKNADNLHVESTKISSLELSALTKIQSEFKINANLSLLTISLPLRTNASTIKIEDNSMMATISLPVLEEVSELRINNNLKLINQNLSALNMVKQNFTFTQNSLITVLNLPALTDAKAGLAIAFNPKLSSLQLPALSTVQNITVGNNAISTLSFPSLLKITNLLVYDNNPDPIYVDLAEVSLPKLTTFSGTNLEIDGKLPTDEVNYLLNKLTSLSPVISGKSIKLRQNPAAPPSGQGSIDKNILITNGNTVSTN